MLGPVATAVLALAVAPSRVDEETRPSAARELRAGIAEAIALRARDRGAIPALARAGEAARERLGSSEVADRIAKLVTDARWREFVGREDAGAELVGAFRDVATDLEFTPRIEADLPVGFPPPTPVGEIEVKAYPAYRLARAESAPTGSQGTFWTLFRHIQSNEIAMTAPVEMEYTSGEGGLRESSMGFLYRSPSLGEPGVDGDVVVLDIEPLHAVSIGCRGRDDRATLEDARRRLLAWIAARPDLEPAGDVRVLGYNSPMVPVRERYFEVQVPVSVGGATDAASPD